MNGFFKSFQYAINGIRAAFEGQRNLKIHMGIALLVLALGFYFSLQPWEWCAILLAIALVLGLEIMNSAIEKLVDLFTKEWSPQAGSIKDMAAAAVLVASVIAAVIGALILGPHILALR